MARRETDHPAGAPEALDPSQGMTGSAGRHILQQGGEIILKNKRAGVIRVEIAPRPYVSGTEITGLIVRGTIVGRRRILPPLPRPLCAVWRNENPTAVQRIETSVRMVFRIKRR